MTMIKRIWAKVWHRKPKDSLDEMTRKYSLDRREYDLDKREDALRSREYRATYILEMFSENKDPDLALDALMESAKHAKVLVKKITKMATILGFATSALDTIEHDAGRIGPIKRISEVKKYARDRNKFIAHQLAAMRQMK